MYVLFLGAALLLTFLVAAGWLLLLTLPWVALSASAAGGAVHAAKHLGERAPALSRNARAAARGILCLEGLDAEPAAARRLRADLARVLALAPAAGNPRACACVKPSGDAFVGVLRVFDRRGHALLRAAGTSAADVARRLSTTLDEHRTTFPARPGTKRAACPECDPKTCPLLLRKRQRALAVA